MDLGGAVTLVGGRVCVSHQSAADVWTIDLVHRAELPTLSVPRNRSRADRHGVRVFRSSVPAADRTEVEGLPVTTPLRTVVDLARSLPLAEAVVVADSALRRGLVSSTELAERLSTVPRARRNDRCRVVAGLVDPAAGSVAESLARVLLLNNGISPPISQLNVHDEDGRFVARVDFAWPAAKLVVEIDGFAYHADRESYRRDRERNNALERLGWRVLRFTWEDVVSRPDYVVALVRGVLADAA